MSIKSLTINKTPTQKPYTVPHHPWIKSLVRYSDTDWLAQDTFTGEFLYLQDVGTAIKFVSFK